MHILDAAREVNDEEGYIMHLIHHIKICQRTDGKLNQPLRFLSKYQGEENNIRIIITNLIRYADINRNAE